MRIRLFIGIRTKLGYLNAKEFEKLNYSEKKEAANIMQMQIADSIGYKKDYGTARSISNNNII